MREATHSSPIWRSRSNFIIAAPIRDGGDIKTEQLWARQSPEGKFQFEICCIPFFVYDMALGDVVETGPDYLARRVLQPSGRYVFRVWFEGSEKPREEVTDEIEALGSLIEWSSANLLAVDAVDLEHANRVENALVKYRDAGRILYEPGRS